MTSAFKIFRFNRYVNMQLICRVNRSILWIKKKSVSASSYGRCVVSCCVEVLTEITSVFIGLISTTLAWYGSSLHTGVLSLMSRMVMFTWTKSAWWREYVRKELLMMQLHIFSLYLLLTKPAKMTFFIIRQGKEVFSDFIFVFLVCYCSTV